MYSKNTIGGSLLYQTYGRICMQSATTSIQHQNLKTFLTAFVGMLLAVPIVAMVTVAVVKAELGSAAFAAPAQTTTQSNNMPAPVGPSCVVPAGSQAATTGASVGAPVPGLWGYGSVSNSFNQTNTSTTTSSTSHSKVYTKIYTDSFNKTIVKDSNNNNGSMNGNVVDSNNGNVTNVKSNNGNNNTTDSGNTTTTNNTSTVVSTTTSVVSNTDSNNTAVNSGNTVNNDNDVVDIL